MPPIDLKTIPEDPGCYLFKDSGGTIIYIGKAKNLKKRVSSYFVKQHDHPKTELLVQAITDVEYFATDSEIEALILENNLVKKNKPKYNINLKDSKRYAYLRLTNEKFPRLVIARQKRDDGTYFGPFTSAAERDAVREVITKAFQVRTCKKLPKKPCLRYHMHLCEAPCVGYISEQEYDAKIPIIKRVLKGNTNQILKELKGEMKKASDQLQFERAKDIRDRISALQYLDEKQKVERQRRYNEDVLAYEVKDDYVYIMLFSVFKGVLARKQEFVIDNTDDFLEEFVTQYYSENPIPKEIITQKAFPNVLKSFLEKKKKQKIIITVPKAGEKKHLLHLAKKNIELTFFGAEADLTELQKLLDLDEPPRLIECFDISHLSGTSVVGSMVQFEHGRPNKSGYRRFRIRVQANDDFQAMEEVVKRRYTRLLKERSRFPDLIIIDGGKGQLSAAVAVLKQLNLRLPIISIAKKEEEIFIPDSPEPLPMSKRDKGLQLIRRIRDEAHRFAINYNKLLRKKKTFES